MTPPATGHPTLWPDVGVDRAIDGAVAPGRTPAGRAGRRLVLRPGDVPQLSAYAAADTALGRRARLVLLLAQGHGPSEVAAALGTSRQTVTTWRERYRQGGLISLHDRPAPGREVDDVLLAATISPPPTGVGPAWSSRSLAERLGVGHSTVARAWHTWGVRPHGAGTFRLAVAPELVAGVGGVLGVVVARDVRLLVLATRPAGTRRADRHSHGEPVAGSGLSTIQVYGSLRAALDEPATIARRGPLDLTRFLHFAGRLHTPLAREWPRLSLLTDDAGLAARPELASWLTTHRRADVHLVPGATDWLRVLRVCLTLAERTAVARGASGCAPELAALAGDLVEGRRVLPGPFVWTDRVRRAH